MSNSTVLLVEDDPTDVFLMQRSFRQQQVEERLVVARNGVEAIDFFLKAEIACGKGEEALPRLILLDLKLPLKSGLELLVWIRSQQNIRRIPVIVFTSSLDKGDIDHAYDSGASGYFLKTGSLEALRGLVLLWRDYWLVKGELAV